MTAYDKLLIARSKTRPTGLEFIKNVISDFIELHGDRRYGDDPAIVGGIGTVRECCDRDMYGKRLHDKKRK
jgi:acetyl-CoA carboxylase carboxyl transferase subunit alpha